MALTLAFFLAHACLSTLLWRQVNPWGITLVLGCGVWWYLERTRPNGRLNPENRSRLPRL